jgi:3-oxoacyl-[acyl-carrier-protein] synthase-3
MASVGVLGLGLYLPNEVRRNDWWPAHIVQEWERKRRESLVREDTDALDVQTEGARRTRDAMGEFRDDLFTGARERRVMSRGETPSSMELAAARDAIERSGLAAETIDLVMVYSQLPDYLIAPQAPLLHLHLGLKRETMVFDTQGACSSFIHQLDIARQFIKSGAVRNALLIQSSTLAHICRPEDHHSVWFGDGATAAVVGQVSEGHGVLATTHMTDGSFHQALMAGRPGERWYEAANLYLYNEDRRCARNMLLLIADLAKEVIDASLTKAAVGPTEVDFYATHQSTLWFRKVTQDHVGLSKARSFDSFGWTGSLGACNVPFMLGMGEREGLLRGGDTVAMYSGGSGITYSSAVVRWGT